MPADNTLQLVIQVDADKANASIKSVNTGLSSIETTAVSTATGASRGIDGMTASIAKGMTVVMQQLARAHGEKVLSFRPLVR